jgi:phospholipid N-methyltransferase
MMSSSLLQAASDFNPIIIMEDYNDSNVVTMHQGDSRTFLKTIPDGAISLVITSLPTILASRMNLSKILRHILLSKRLLSLS